MHIITLFSAFTVLSFVFSGDTLVLCTHFKCNRKRFFFFPLDCDKACFTQSIRACASSNLYYGNYVITFYAVQYMN